MPFQNKSIIPQNLSSILGKFIRKKEIFVLFFVLLTTVLVFYPSLWGQFINWDDRIHILDNPEVSKLDWNHVKAIFSSTASLGYIPLSIFSFAVENHFFGLNPFFYHLDNLLLHLLVTALVFYLGLRMGLNVLAAGLAALIFGIHPMHVESVAWISARKDGLYGVFYLLALHSYWSHLENGKKQTYVLMLVWGLLSMLAKPMALSLPLVLLLLDGMKGRKIGFHLLWNKIPVFLYIIPLTLMTYRLQAHPIDVPPLEAVLMWLWCASFYLWKFLWPAVLVPMYTRPEPVQIFNPVYAAALLTVVGCFAGLIWFRSHRWLIFAGLFYLCSLFFVFRFDTSQINVVADRYMYLPSIGFCFLFGYCVDQIWNHLNEKNNLLKWVAALMLMGLMISLAVKSVLQISIWKDSLTVWSSMLKHHPNHWYALYGRAKAYEHQGKFDLALEDYARALEVKPNFIWVYNNRGTMLLNMGRYDEAFEDLNRGIQLEPKDAEVFNNRSLIFTRRQQYKSAVEDLNAAIKLKPNFLMAIRNRGLAYATLKQYDRALEDFDRGLQIDSSMTELYYCRALAYLRLSRYPEALKNAEKARELGMSGLDPMIEDLQR